MKNEINFEIKTSTKARHLRITVYPNQKVIVTKPRLVSQIKAEEFVNRKSGWIQGKLEYYKNRKVTTLSSPSVSKTEVLEFVKSRLDFYNQHYKFNIGKVSIKNHKYLWGSCSSRKNLNFNIKIMQLSERQADYIIVHELCHLKEFNHSKNFWALVAKIIQEYKELKKQLRNYTFY